MQRLHSIIFVCTFIVLLNGCSRGPSRVKPPSIDPESAAADAIERYDANKDGTLDTAELGKCPAVLATQKAYDTDGNGKITAEEFAARITSLRKFGVGMTRLMCKVRLNDKPLQGATVDFEPESYLGSEIKSAHGTTDDVGMTPIAIATEELPSDLQDLKGLHYGTYKVRVTHPKIKLPPKYNTETTLGYETRIGDPYATFELKTP